MRSTRRGDDKTTAVQTLGSLSDAVWTIQSFASDVGAAALAVRMCLEADDVRGALRTGDLLFDWTRRLNRMARRNATAIRSVALANARALVADIRRTTDP